jgi:hypothetical protein
MFNISKAYEIELFVIAEISEDINNYGLYKTNLIQALKQKKTKTKIT